MSYLYGEFEAELNGSHFGVYVRAYNMLFLYHTFTRLCCLHCAHCWECAAHACTSVAILSPFMPQTRKKAWISSRVAHVTAFPHASGHCARPRPTPHAQDPFSQRGRGLNLVTR